MIWRKKTVQSLVCDRSTGDVFKTEMRSFTGELNPSCTADIVMGMYADSYYFAGGFDDWFYETDSDLTIDDLEAHFFFPAYWQMVQMWTRLWMPYQIRAV